MTLICEILSHWPERKGQQLMILCNKDHWAYYKFKELNIKGDIDYLVRCPFLTTQDMVERIKVSVKNPLLRKTLRTFMRILRPVYTLYAVWRIKDLLRHHDINSLFSHNGGYPGGDLSRIAVLAAGYAGIKKNYMIIHNLPSQTGSLLNWMNRVEDRLVSSAVKKLYSVSNSCAAILQQECFPWATVGVIPNAIRTRQSKSRSANKPPVWRHAPHVIGFIGELHPRKGLDVLMASLAGLPNTFNLVLVGNGSEAYTHHLKKLTRQMGLTAQVFFLGFREDAAEIIQYFDMVVLPSVAYESFGMVLLEAMYWRKPVICSDFGGMKEVVPHKRTGLVVPAGDADALSRAIQYLLDHPATAVRWGQAGYERLKKHYDINALANTYCRLS